MGSGDRDVIETKNERACLLQRSTIDYNDAPEQHFGSALAKPSPSSHEFETKGSGS
jgi:hypothetical protein